MEAGYEISKPIFGHSTPYDLIADRGGGLLKVQVKTGRLRQNTIRFCACSHTGSYAGDNKIYRERRLYLENELDAFAIYCPPIHKTYLVPANLVVGKQSGCLVLKGNRARKNSKLAKDFEV